MENWSVAGLLVRELPVPDLPSESTVVLSLGTYALPTSVYYIAFDFMAAIVSSSGPMT